MAHQPSGRNGERASSSFLSAFFSMRDTSRTGYCKWFGFENCAASGGVVICLDGELSCLLKLCKAEFDEKLFVLRQFNSLDQAYQQLPVGAGSIEKPLYQFLCLIGVPDRAFELLLQFADTGFVPVALFLDSDENALEVSLRQKSCETVRIHAIQILRQRFDFSLNKCKL